MTAAASPPPSPPNSRAAFSREDVSDAKRGHPDFDLREFAAGRGLEWLDHATPAGYRAAVQLRPSDQARRADRHRSFAGELPPPLLGEWRESEAIFKASDAWHAWAQETAARYRLTREDPLAAAG